MKKLIVMMILMNVTSANAGSNEITAAKTAEALQKNVAVQGATKYLHQTTDSCAALSMDDFKKGDADAAFSASMLCSVVNDGGDSSTTLIVKGSVYPGMKLDLDSITFEHAD